MARLRPILFLVLLGCSTAQADESLIFLTKEEAKKQKEETRELQLKNREMTKRAETLEQQVEDLKKKNDALLQAAEAAMETLQELLDQPRSWTAVTGDRFVAKLGSITEEKVVLVNAKGEKRPVPRRKLSKRDQELLDMVEQARKLEETITVVPTVDPNVPQGIHAVDIIKVPATE